MLEIKNICARLGNFSLDNISVTATEGDYLTILGLSGAGKTVLLEVLAGLVQPSSGEIILQGKDITRLPIQERPVGLVYQDMALFPHMTVRKNIAYPLKEKNLRRSEKNRIIDSLAEQVQASHLLDRHPATLSGGEAQRVALARTLASDPKILLLDEPLASLDIKLRQELRELLKQINLSGKTIIHVTHDHMEAATLSKHIAIIEKGSLTQWGKPEEVFRNPLSEFAARFSGIKNIFPCSLQAVNGNGLISAITPSGLTIKLLNKPEKDNVFLMIPGEDIILSEEKITSSAINQFQGEVKEIHTLNFGVEIIVECVEKFSVIITRKSFNNMQISTGKLLWLNFKASAVRIL